MKTIIKNGKILQGNQLVSKDILVENEKITSIDSRIDEDKAEKVIDAKGAFVAPGLIDVHVHYREPGFTDKETIETGSKAAARGGFTTVCAMPNLDPTPDTVDRFRAQSKLNENKGVVRIKQYATITENREGNQLVDFDGLKQAGAFAFSNDGSGIQTSETMFNAMKEAKRVNMAIVAHVEDISLVAGGVLAEEAAARLNVKPISWVSETAQVARDLVLAQESGAHYHICHVSSKHTVEAVRQAKKAGINVTCEVTPHHLLLTEDDIQTDNSFYKMNPPLRSKSDQEALVAGLLDGTIDMIATDHAPHTAAEKDQSVTKAPFGITGSETAFAMLYTKYVKAGIFSLDQLINWLAGNPSSVFNMGDLGTLKVGGPADIAVFDLDNSEEIKKADFASKGKNSPFVGENVYGNTLLTMVDGNVVYQK
ncbi:dihydroorotase [Lentilactobacillus sp. Marseille-Q4993]|uniref:dihydroorotase n=1 Tax=Lentilactobacillus sp. Marseille-Q4993 TaxID=3039492 RepID=UPI0024BC8AE2|nr:dihydroorotase [Lentilactobacillus sp. Marseille-Q4993]